VIRRTATRLMSLAAPPVIAVLTGFLIAAVSVALMGIEPIGAFGYFSRGVSASAYGIAEILVKAIPLLFTGLSVAFAQRAGLLNIGAEGQLQA